MTLNDLLFEEEHELKNSWYSASVFVGNKYVDVFRAHMNNKVSVGYRVYVYKNEKPLSNTKYIQCWHGLDTLAAECVLQHLLQTERTHAGA